MSSNNNVIAWIGMPPSTINSPYAGLDVELYDSLDVSIFESMVIYEQALNSLPINKFPIYIIDANLISSKEDGFTSLILINKLKNLPLSPYVAVVRQEFHPLPSKAFYNSGADYVFTNGVDDVSDLVSNVQEGLNGAHLFNSLLDCFK